MLGNEGSDCDDAAQSDCLAALVEQAFPALRLENHRLESSGGDHVLLIVDDRFVFRFPRQGMHSLNLEIAVLKNLQGYSPIATPAYSHVDPAGRFAGYKLIRGSALTPACFATLSRARRRDVLQAAARFLSALHALSPDAVAPPGDWPVTPTPAEYADLGLAEYMPTILRHLPQWAPAIETFYRRYRRLTPPGRVVIHGDLVAEHLLLDERTRRLGGIIDFGDVAFGDPAQDFLGFWDYGAAAVRQVVDLYAGSAADRGLLTRSRDHFIRYRLDRIFETVRSGEFDPELALAQLVASFTADRLLMPQIL